MGWGHPANVSLTQCSRRVMACVPLYSGAATTYTSGRACTPHLPLHTDCNKQLCASCNVDKKSCKFCFLDKIFAILKKRYDCKSEGYTVFSTLLTCQVMTLVLTERSCGLSIDGPVRQSSPVLSVCLSPTPGRVPSLGCWD